MLTQFGLLAYISFHWPVEAIKLWFMRTGHEDRLGHKERYFYWKLLPLKLAIIVFSNLYLEKTIYNLIRSLHL